MLTYFLGRGVKMLTVADMGEEGIKNGQKSADVLYGRPLSLENLKLDFSFKIESEFRTWKGL